MDQDFTCFSIYKDFDVVNLKSEDTCLLKPINYYIRSSFNSLSGTGQTKYYAHQLFDENFNPLLDNIIDQKGLVCIISKKEYWGVPYYFQNHQTTVIEATIFDKERSEIKINFSNKGLLGDGLKKMFQYLKILDTKGTHINSKNDLMNLVKKR